MSNIYVLNCFKYFLIYILGQKVSKKKLDQKKLELYQVFMRNLSKCLDRISILLQEKLSIFLCCIH